MYKRWWRTYEKPLKMVYSCPILPPWSVACFFAAATCSSVVSGLRVTCDDVVSKDLIGEDEVEAKRG